MANTNPITPSDKCGKEDEKTETKGNEKPAIRPAAILTGNLCLRAQANMQDTSFETGFILAETMYYFYIAWTDAE